MRFFFYLIISCVVHIRGDVYNIESRFNKALPNSISIKNGLPNFSTNDTDEEELAQYQHDYYVITKDLQKVVDKERADNPPDDYNAGLKPDFRFDNYHTFDAINGFMDSVVARFPLLASTEILGITFEGRPIKGLKLGCSGFNKYSIWLDAGIHSNEWIAPASAIYIINRLVTNYETDDGIKSMLNDFDLYIFPNLNPDGYNYSWTQERMWRKNRFPYITANGTCFGVDLNRNFPTLFGGEGSSNRPCSYFYHGPFPFSEIETRAIRDRILQLGTSLKLYISLHSYEQKILSPYCYPIGRTRDYESQMEILKAMAEAVTSVHDVKYEYGSLTDVYPYPCSGTSVDWVYDKANVKYSLTIELRDTGDQGFLLSNKEIIPTAEEIFAGIKAAVNVVKKKIY